MLMGNWKVPFPIHGGMLANDEPVRISEKFDGLIDELAIFNRPLSAAEIRAIYAAGSSGMLKPPPFASPQN